MKHAHLIGALVASFAFLFVIFAGTLGQLFTMSGKTDRMPAYDTEAVRRGWDIGYSDPYAYDERGKVIDFSVKAGEVSELSDKSDSCPDNSYVFALKNRNIWMKGATLDAVVTSLREQIDPLLQTCAVPADVSFACSQGCRRSGEDTVTLARPLDIRLKSADAIGPGTLQYIFIVNGGCIRLRQCTPSGT